jgi:hypothetical protein
MNYLVTNRESEEFETLELLLQKKNSPWVEPIKARLAELRGPWRNELRESPRRGAGPSGSDPIRVGRLSRDKSGQNHISVKNV